VKRQRCELAEGIFAILTLTVETECNEGNGNLSSEEVKLIQNVLSRVYSLYIARYKYNFPRHD